MEPYKPRALGYCRCHSSPTDEETEGQTEAMGLAKAATTCLVEHSSPHGDRGYGAGQGWHHVRGRAQLPARAQRLWGWPRPPPHAWWSTAPRMGSVGPRTERRSSSVPVPAEKIRR